MLGAVEARRDYVPKALKAMADYDGAAVAVFIRDSNPHSALERYGQPQADHSENVLRGTTPHWRPDPAGPRGAT